MRKLCKSSQIESSPKNGPQHISNFLYCLFYFFFFYFILLLLFSVHEVSSANEKFDLFEGIRGVHEVLGPVVQN